MILLQYCFCFILWFFGFQACGILASGPEIKPTPPMLEGGVLTTGPPGKAPRYVLLISDAQGFSCNRKEKPDSDGDDEETTGARMASLRCASLEANPTPTSWRLGVPPVRLSPQTRTRCLYQPPWIAGTGTPPACPLVKVIFKGSWVSLAGASDSTPTAGVEGTITSILPDLMTDSGQSSPPELPP